MIYAPAVVALLGVGGRSTRSPTSPVAGCPGNLVRVLPPGCRAVVDRGRWDVPRIFAEIQRAGRVSDEEMTRVFNLGLGMVVVVPAAEVEATLAVLEPYGHAARVVGEVVAGAGPPSRL